MFNSPRDIIDKAKKVVDKAKDCIQKEREISIPDVGINAAIECNIERLNESAGAIFKEVRVKSSPGLLHVHGSVSKTVKSMFGKKSVAADFQLQIKPVEPVWTDSDHRLRFVIDDHNIEIDNGPLNVIEKLCLKVIEDVFRCDIAAKKMNAVSDADGVISVSLDNIDIKLDNVIRFVRINRITPRLGSLEISLQGDSIF